MLHYPKIQGIKIDLYINDAEFHSQIKYFLSNIDLKSLNNILTAKN
jgi:hypothetical protein